MSTLPLRGFQLSKVAASLWAQLQHSQACFLACSGLLQASCSAHWGGTHKQDTLQEQTIPGLPQGQFICPIKCLCHQWKSNQMWLLAHSSPCQTGTLQTPCQIWCSLNMIEFRVAYWYAYYSAYELLIYILYKIFTIVSDFTGSWRHSVNYCQWFHTSYLPAR